MVGFLSKKTGQRMQNKIIWHKVLENKNFQQENRVMTLRAGHTQVCLSHFDNGFQAISNKCPHQGGPLGAGSIENGLLRCPCYDYIQRKRSNF